MEELHSMLQILSYVIIGLYSFFIIFTPWWFSDEKRCLSSGMEYGLKYLKCKKEGTPLWLEVFSSFILSKYTLFVITSIVYLSSFH